MTYKLPLVILGGTNKPKQIAYTRQFHKQKNKHFLLGYKMAELQLEGKPFIQNLIERFRKSGYFKNIYVAGPNEVYKDKVDCPVINTDSNLGQNIRNSLEYIVKKYGIEAQYGISFGDIMPTVQDIQTLMHELEPYREADFIYELVENPQNLGNSAWKPAYILLNPKGEQMKYLPGHLAIVRPQNLRTDFGFQLVSLWYASKNRSPAEKFNTCLHNLYLLLPYTFAVIESFPYSVHGITQFVQRKLSINDTERKFTHVLIDLLHRLSSPGPHVYIHTTSLFSFAKDVDTEEELEEISLNFSN